VLLLPTTIVGRGAVSHNVFWAGNRGTMRYVAVGLPVRNPIRKAGFSMRFVAYLFCIGVVVAADSVAADGCLVTGPRARLDSESVDWQLVIASGQRCVRGLRSSTMILHNVSISDPAQNGEATAEGYGFVYKARPNFKGEDAFAVTMTGVERGIRGTTIVRVRVSVR
jgi:hypothetical protein